MPSSSSHALIGGLVGAGLAAGWTRRHRLVERSQKTAHRDRRLARWSRSRSPSSRCTSWPARRSCPSGRTTPSRSRCLQLVSAAAVSFGHGANDAQKTMGVIAALLVGAGYTDARRRRQTSPVPEWVALVGLRRDRPRHGVGRLEDHRDDGPAHHARCTPSSGVAANIGATTAIFGATGDRASRSRPPTPPPRRSMGAGVGVRARASTSRSSARWCSPGSSRSRPRRRSRSCVFKLTQLPAAAAWVAVARLLFVVGGAIAYAMTHPSRPRTSRRRSRPEEQLAEHVPPVPHIEGEGPVAVGRGEPGEALGRARSVSLSGVGASMTCQTPTTGGPRDQERKPC